MHIELEQVLPMDIERRSFDIIESELPHPLDPRLAPIIKRVIHTTADFSFADSLCFSPGVVEKALTAIRGGACIVTDTNMGKAGVNKSALAKHGGEVFCFMADEDVRLAAKENGTTRAVASMDKVRQRGAVQGADYDHRCALHRGPGPQGRQQRGRRHLQRPALSPGPRLTRPRPPCYNTDRNHPRR